jgi:hypothetical protein
MIGPASQKRHTSAFKNESVERDRTLTDVLDALTGSYEEWDYEDWAVQDGSASEAWDAWSSGDDWEAADHREARENWEFDEFR